MHAELRVRSAGVIDAFERADHPCGHSMGGHNAMALAAWHPERLRGLIVVDSRPAMPAERLDLMHRRGHRGPRRHENLETALRSFRLIPADTVADPSLLAHLAREGIVERDGRFLYRFDPACGGCDGRRISGRCSIGSPRRPARAGRALRQAPGPMAARSRSDSHVRVGDPDG
jgi:pimeloyl-ACP methyl ester carboxylesterase